MDLDQWIWINRSGTMDVEQWIWNNGYGAMEMEQSGTMDLEQ
jgi:hypothetical protein